MTHIIHAIATTNNNKDREISILKWEGEVDQEIASGIKTSKPFSHNGVMGSIETPQGNIPWALWMFDTLENFENNPDNLFSFTFSLYPDKFSLQWLENLKSQSELLLNIDTFIYQILDKEGVEKLLKTFGNIEWRGSLQSWQIEASRIQPQLETVKDKQIEVVKQALRGSKVEQVLKLCKDKLALISNSELGKLAKEDKLASLERELKSWRLNTSLAELSSITTNKEEEAKKDWLYLTYCLEQYPNQLRIAIGQTQGKWNWYSTNLSINEIWARTTNYRSLLGVNFKIPNPKSIPLIKITQLNIDGIRYLQDKVEKIPEILNHAIGCKEYGFKTAEVIFNRRDCKSLQFLSQTPDNSECLVLYNSGSTRRTDGEFGLAKLNAKTKTIEWIVPQEIDQQAKKILNFLIAISYRDLLVSRGSKNTANPSNRSGKKQKQRKQQIEPVTLIPRFKTTNTTIKLSKPEEVLNKLSKYYRTEHLRSLPEGWKPSENAKKLAGEFGFSLPEGYTFVSPANVEYESIKQYKTISLIELFIE